MPDPTASRAPGPSPAPEAERALWGPRHRRFRRFWRMLPASPRCKMCNGPFRGPFASVFRAVGKGPWRNNPHYCGWCFRDLLANRTGAEIECTLLFADVRGSTEMAEGMRPSEFRSRMDDFYRIASDRLIEREAIVDKFVGDEVVAIFVPSLTGGEHAAQAIDAGRALLEATRPDGESPIAIGIGVNTGIAYVGAVGTDEHLELSAMGDPVNVAARLAGAAGAGELLVSLASMGAAGLALGNVERRRLALKGKSEPMEVVVLGSA